MSALFSKPKMPAVNPVAMPATAINGSSLEAQKDVQLKAAKRKNDNQTLFAGANDSGVSGNGPVGGSQLKSLLG